jgi:hypothetical protein
VLASASSGAADAADAAISDEYALVAGAQGAGEVYLSAGAGGLAGCMGLAGSDYNINSVFIQNTAVFM